MTGLIRSNADAPKKPSDPRGGNPIVAFGVADCGNDRIACAGAAATVRRVRPSDPEWPSAATWEKLNQAIGGHRIKVEPLFASCGNEAGASCDDVLAALKNPYYVGDQAVETQSVG